MAPDRALSHTGAELFRGTSARAEPRASQRWRSLRSTQRCCVAAVRQAVPPRRCRRRLAPSPPIFSDPGHVAAEHVRAELRPGVHRADPQAGWPERHAGAAGAWCTCLDFCAAVPPQRNLYAAHARLPPTPQIEKLQSKVHALETELQHERLKSKATTPNGSSKDAAFDASGDEHQDDGHEQVAGVCLGLRRGCVPQ